jgi:uncharacterized membrane protein YccF (DUF307 family)
MVNRLEQKEMSATNNSQPVVAVRQGSGCLVQILWFVFIGWWLGSFAVAAAYVMFVFIITIPIGIAILNNIPKIMALREPPKLVTPYGAVETPQHNIILRSLWFVLVGWWLAAIVMTIAYALCMTVIGLPIGFLMFDWVPGVLTLRRS